MITLRTDRHHAEAALLKFFPYINRYKQTRLNNVAHQSLASQEYLIAVVINQMLEEIETLIEKKLYATKSGKVKLELSNAQGVLLYRSLLALPFDGNEIYAVMVMSRWIQDLDAELIREQIYHRNKPVKSVAPRRTASDYYDV